MFIGKLPEVSRRAFLRRSAQLASLGAASSYALGLAGIGEAAAFSSADGYKALVCVFLLGGNDHNNTLIPYDSTNYAKYRAIRGLASDGSGVGLGRSQLGAPTLARPCHNTYFLMLETLHTRTKQLRSYPGTTHGSRLSRIQ